MSDAQTYVIPATVVGSMVESLDPGVLPVGGASEIRNVMFTRGRMRRRAGWARMFATRLPCDTVINAKGGAFRDTAGRLHRLYAGSDGKLYHALGETPTTYTEVVVHQDVAWTWDVTYRAVFAPWTDACFITFWQPPENATIPPAGAQNLRFDATSDAVTPGQWHAYGVSIPAPLVAPTLAAAAGGGIPFGIYSYFVTIKDAVTGWESDRSPIAEIILAQPDAPSQSPVLADGGVGLLAAGTYEYATCFYQSVLGYRSPLSLPTQIIHDALSQTAITNIRICPEAGAAWHREVYRRMAGGVWNLHITLANNTAQAAADNVAAQSGVEYDEGTMGVNLTAIALYGGGGTPVNGRDVYRCIYRSDNAAGYRRLTAADAELLNNTGVAYADTVDYPPNNADSWTRQVAVPLMGVVCAGPDNSLLWLNDKANALPAQLYQSTGDQNPESIDVDATQEAIIVYKAGTHDDPITAAEDARDGWGIGKRRGIYYSGRECSACERVLKDRGNVAPGTMQVIDTRVAVLTPEGPGYLDHTRPGDFTFCGPNPEKFCLPITWGSVVKDRLPYASSFHWRSEAIIGWIVQRCDEWPVGPHNDTAILWDYSMPNGGRVWIVDWPGCDCFMQIPAAGSGTDTVEACFAYGIAATLFDGEHNDGVVGKLLGTVLAVSGNTVDVAASALGGQDVVGSILWINSGTGTRVCRPVDACENARALIVSACGGRITTAGELGIAAGSGFEIGGFQERLALPINTGNPMAIKKWLTAHVRTD